MVRSCLFAQVPRSWGPMTISASSSFLFSPDRNLAYRARNKLRWLKLGSICPLLDLVLAGVAFALPLPLGVDLDASFEPAIPAKVESGRNMEEQRSNSRQSKKDLASRYLFISLASNKASLGSGLGPKAGDVKPGASDSSASSMDMSGSGIEFSSSAALGRRRNQHFWTLKTTSTNAAGINAAVRGWGQRRGSTILTIGIDIVRSTSPQPPAERCGVGTFRGRLKPWQPS